MGPHASEAPFVGGLVASQDMCRYHPFPWQRMSLPEDDSVVEFVPHQDPVEIRWPPCRDVFLNLSLEPEYAARSWSDLREEKGFEEGSLAIIAPGHEVRWDCPRGRSAAIHVFLSEDSIRRAALEPGDSRPLEIVSAIDARDSQLERLVRRLHRELAMEDGGSKLHRDVLLRCIAYRLVRDHSAWPPRRRLPRARLTAFDVARVDDYIRANLAGDVGIETLAALGRRSPYDFMRLFKLTTGHTAHQYVTRLRIEAAQQRLRRKSGGLSLADLSAELGFADQSHFTRCFKRATGSTPGRFPPVTVPLGGQRSRASDAPLRAPAASCPEVR